MRSLAMLALLCFTSLALSAQDTGAPPLTRFLNPDGSLMLDSGYTGGVDISGHEMRTGADGRPQFVAKSSVATTPVDPGVWTPFGGLPNGCNGEVSAISPMPSGEEIAYGGHFSVCGSVVVDNFALYRPSSNTWRALRGGLPRVSDLLVFNGDLYAAASQGVYRLNAGTGIWTQIGATNLSSSFQSLAVFNGQLHVGGSFTSIDGTAVNRVARWDGGAWSALGSGLLGDNFTSVWAMAATATHLYVGGKFATAGGNAANSIASWNGSAWGSLGAGAANGVDDFVFDLATIGNVLYVGGQFGNAGGLSANRIARWSGSAWATLGTGATNGVGGVIQALNASGNDLYVGGSFFQAGGVAHSNLARWNHVTESWHALGSGANGEVSALVVAGGSVYAGGSFSRSGTLAVNAAMRLDGSSGVAVRTPQKSRGSRDLCAVPPPPAFLEVICAPQQPETFNAPPHQNAIRFVKATRHQCDGTSHHHCCGRGDHPVRGAQRSGLQPQKCAHRAFQRVAGCPHAGAPTSGARTGAGAGRGQRG